MFDNRSLCLSQEARKTLKQFSDISEDELTQLEKSIGSAVGKARSYYDARLRLREAKDTLTKAKHRFERAQALHVAAKELAVVSVGIPLPYRSVRTFS